jgi:hypothetical protein
VGLKLNGTHQLLGYADGVNLLGDNIDTTTNHSEILKTAIFWDITPCGSYKSQGHNIPEDGIFRSHCHENLKSYTQKL